MGCLATHPDPIATRSLDARDDANRNAKLLKDRPLLDMRFQKGRNGKSKIPMRYVDILHKNPLGGLSDRHAGSVANLKQLIE